MVNYLAEIKENAKDQVFLLVKGCNTNIARNGHDFQKIVVFDLSGKEYTLLKFRDLLNFIEPMIIKATVSASKYNDCISYVIEGCSKTDDKSILEFMPKANIDVKNEWNSFTKYIGLIDEPLRTFICNIVNDYKKDYVFTPLYVNGPYSRVSGLFEATITLLQTAYDFASKHNLCLNVILPAAVLYYIGECERHNMTFTDTYKYIIYKPGLIAFRIINDKYKEYIKENENNEDKEKLNIDEKIIDAINHCLLTKDKIVVASTQEASCLYFLSRMIMDNESMNEALKDADDNSFVASPYTYSKQLYKFGLEKMEEKEKEAYESK